MNSEFHPVIGLVTEGKLPVLLNMKESVEDERLLISLESKDHNMNHIFSTVSGPHVYLITNVPENIDCKLSVFIKDVEIYCFHVSNLKECKKICFVSLDNRDEDSNKSLWDTVKLCDLCIHLGGTVKTSGILFSRNIPEEYRKSISYWSRIIEGTQNILIPSKCEIPDLGSDGYAFGGKTYASYLLNFRNLCPQKYYVYDNSKKLCGYIFEWKSKTILCASTILGNICEILERIDKSTVKSLIIAIESPPFPGEKSKLSSSFSINENWDIEKSENFLTQIKNLKYRGINVEVVCGGVQFASQGRIIFDDTYIEIYTTGTVSCQPTKIECDYMKKMQDYHIGEFRIVMNIVSSDYQRAFLTLTSNGKFLTWGAKLGENESNSKIHSLLKKL